MLALGRIPRLPEVRRQHRFWKHFDMCLDIWSYFLFFRHLLQSHNHELQQLLGIHVVLRKPDPAFLAGGISFKKSGVSSSLYI